MSAKNKQSLSSSLGRLDRMEKANKRTKNKYSLKADLERLDKMDSANKGKSKKSHSTAPIREIVRDEIAKMHQPLLKDGLTWDDTPEDAERRTRIAHEIG